MNLKKLFEAQQALDEHIEREHPRKPREDRLAKKILALLVELGELANEWRGFKFWSNDQEPRTKVQVYTGSGRRIDGKYKNPLLEEYVDGLHFLLIIGLDENIGVLKEVEISKLDSITTQFLELFDQVTNLLYDVSLYPYVFGLFLSLGEMFGFTWEQIEEAYFQKNSINHER